MSNFITSQIVKAYAKGLENGQAKYRAYFINTSIYSKYQEEVNTNLKEQGKADAIVSA